MHELSICRALLTQVEAIARERQAREVTTIVLRIGPLSGVEGHLLEFACPLASAGTIAENAELVIEALPVRVSCQSCGADSEAQVNRLLCGQCGDWHTRLIAGDELLLASVELSLKCEV